MSDINTYPAARSLRLRGKTPDLTHIDKSYPILLRDGILSRVKAMSFFSTFTFSTNKMLQIQPHLVPFCGIYLIQEMLSPDGDADAGEIRFRTLARMGFSVIIVNNDSEKAEYILDSSIQTICSGLFSDPTFYNNSLYKIQGITSGSRQHVFGSIGQDNQTPIAELRFEMTVDLGTIIYEPKVMDDLEVIHVKTAFPVRGTQDEKDATQQVTTEYDLEQ